MPKHANLNCVEIDSGVWMSWRCCRRRCCCRCCCCRRYLRCRTNGPSKHISPSDRTNICYWWIAGWILNRMYTKFPMVYFHLNVFTRTRADGISPQINSTYGRVHAVNHTVFSIISLPLCWFDTYELFCLSIRTHLERNLSAILIHGLNVAELWPQKMAKAHIVLSICPKVKPLNIIWCLYCFDLLFNCFLWSSTSFFGALFALLFLLCIKKAIFCVNAHSVHKTLAN